MTNKPNLWIKDKMKQLREGRGNRCEKILTNFQRCTSTRNLQFHHIAETDILDHISRNGWHYRGRKERYYDIKRHPDSYKLLCEKHHKEAHNYT